ncbi:hypothetical protein BSU04_34200 [Caballeronia sordidicola]|uniref:Uncharacterized protein n=1 Tax=Caballeronia sordidicola TaxID=196367 RepID=A0A226WRW7_CABSO|nr:hypothetical protein BSU04_34200 [Caballeronia sordidicola]
MPELTPRSRAGPALASLLTTPAQAGPQQMHREQALRMTQALHMVRFASHPGTL